jgi:peptidyl-prolyl cis-trans isomerase C
MPYQVNGQLVAEELIREEEARIGRDLRWSTIPDEAERARRLRTAAEQSAIERMLVAQAASSDPRPIDSAAVEQEVARQKSAAGCRNAFDDSLLRRRIEQQFRLQRLSAEMTAGAGKPGEDEIQAFYEANREHFCNPDLFEAAHIVKHVNQEQSEAQARAAIEAALAELEGGAGFAETAERHSDCKGNGGDLGQFPAGHMVEEFEQAIRALSPGGRTGIFRTPFGFHIAELRALIPGRPAGFDEVRADIERVFVMRNEHQMYLRAVEKLRSGADIRVVETPPAGAKPA